MSVCLYAWRLRCEPCMAGGCFTEPTAHDWASDEDIAHALAQGQPSPAGQPCSCLCTTEGRPDLRPLTEDEVLIDEALEGTYGGTACPECGEYGPCAYDNEGRPLIHTTPPED